jgi:hypothetical protein
LNATTLVVGGIDVKTAQVRLGHADLRMTLAICAAAAASVDRAAADVIGAICATSAPDHPGASES